MTGAALPSPTGTEARVCADIAERQQLGIAKYGQTVADNPLSLQQWLQHAYEECLDQAVYLRRAIEEAQAADERTALARPALAQVGKSGVTTPWFYGAYVSPVRDGRYQVRFRPEWRAVFCEWQRGRWWVGGGGLEKPVRVHLRLYPTFSWRGLHGPIHTDTTGAPA